MLFVVIAAGVIASEAQLSMEVFGAFSAGLLLAETEYPQATVEPVKGLLLGIFFFTVGMNIDVRELLNAPGLLLTAVVIAVKALLLIGLAKLFHLSWVRGSRPACCSVPGRDSTLSASVWRRRSA